MVLCLVELGAACTPRCRNCGREMVPHEHPPDTGRGRRYWQRQCGCVIKTEPQEDFGFTADEVARFTALLASRGLEIDDHLGRYVLNGLAATGTKTVFDVEEQDLVITAAEAAAAIGRPLG